jgi:hypothetical protein
LRSHENRRSDDNYGVKSQEGLGVNLGVHNFPEVIRTAQIKHDRIVPVPGPVTALIDGHHCV